MDSYMIIIIRILPYHRKGIIETHIQRRVTLTPAWQYDSI